ncbi:class I SAM-dependent methyltransferase [Mycolicibacterium sp. 120270]|uniref:class I SAM-dependent methyltransferase n=1 Tax=Mycolicibacterium sp. 120270 TaxID=3090600 RepID=UPI00299DDD72|nr:class I SAM-dependent methyltransferase [Mycolicibacterium sp. 120270]MDX1886446.1 class I SAM-dependent methyltransferase [Mycolicibacterium sp. 120270]
MTDTGATTDNPFFARLWTFLSNHETKEIQRLRTENLAGLSGRVLEVGAGTGTNFAHYPATVTEVVAVEPEVRLAPQAQAAAQKAPVPVTVYAGTVEKYLSDAVGEPFDAVVCSLVLCSVDDPDSVLQQLFSLVRPGGELRFLEHVATGGIRGRLQKIADATVWPRLMGNCHTHRDTEASIVGAGFAVNDARLEPALPAWLPTPVAEYTIGRATKPAV